MRRIQASRCAVAATSRLCSCRHSGTENCPLDETLRRQSRVADLRYRGGVSSYLEALDTERQRLTAGQNFSRRQFGEALALMQLYKALGGGWQ
jgi:hypothetical protein